MKSKNKINQRYINKKTIKLGGKIQVLKEKYRIDSKTFNRSKKNKINQTFVNKKGQLGGKLPVPNDIYIIPNQSRKKSKDGVKYVELNELTDYEIEERNIMNKSILESIIIMWEKNKHDWFQNIEDIEIYLEDALHKDLNDYGVWPDKIRVCH